MSDHGSLLQTVSLADGSVYSDSVQLAQRIEYLRSLASADPQERPGITSSDVDLIVQSPDVIRVLLQQHPGQVGIKGVVGFACLHYLPVDMRILLSPICVDIHGTPRGSGSALMTEAITYVSNWKPNARSIDLTNRPDHDLRDWYRRFGFAERDTRVFRLRL